MHPKSHSHTSPERVKGAILKRVVTSCDRLTPAQICREFTRRFQCKKKQILNAIRALVAENSLIYTYQFGCTFLERSFQRPVRISNRVVLLPPNTRYDKHREDIVVTIAPGAAFGSGAHPTTRLALTGLEIALDRFSPQTVNGGRMLDIGTGSGVLAIAAVKMGMAQAVGTDIDACARAEARTNAAANGLASCIAICASLEAFEKTRFALIAANLRTPTLKSLCPWITRHLGANGLVVLSGIRQEEFAGVKTLFEKSGFASRWESNEQQWVGQVLQLTG